MLLPASLLLAALAAAGQDQRAPYAIDPARSQITIAVGKAGALSFMAGHTHEVIGPVGGGTLEIDRNNPPGSRVRLVIRAADLKVTGKGEPPGDVPKVQETMDGEKVLDVGRYPEIVFESTSVTVRQRRGDAMDLLIGGRLTLRGATRPVTIPVHAELSADTLTATGRFSIRQTEYGIRPVSVAGVVNVKDSLEIQFAIAARASRGGAQAKRGER